MAMEIEVNGHRVEVDDSFASLSPEAQQAQVNEIASMLPKPEQEVKAEEKETSELYSTPGVVAIGGAALGAVDQALGQPIESIAARKTGAQKIINPATGEHAGWKWARKTGFGAGLDPTVEGQSSEFQKRKAEGTFEKKPGQVKPIPGKALTLEKHMQNVARDELEAKLKAQAAARQAPGYTSTKPTTLTGKGLGLGGRMLAGAGALGMGKEAYDEGARALELAKSGDYGAAARAGRGALLNALGAAGSAATYVPHPLVRGLGTAVGLGAPALNLLLEKAGYAQGGLAHLSKGKKVAKEAFEYGGKQLGKLSDWAQDYIGSYFVPTQSDRMRYVGGPSFSANQLGQPEYKDIVWGSGKPGTATGIANLAKDPRFGGVENQIFAPLLGEAKMHQSNQMIFDRMVEDFFKNPEKLTPELRQTINDYIRSGGLAVSGTKKSKSFEPIPEFDIANRQMIESLGKTFDNRKLIAQHAFGGKDIGGRKAQIIPYEKILQETTDPTVLGAPTFSMGPRAFKLTGETLDVPRHDLNPAYPYKLLGQDLGVTYNPAPSELSLMDFQRKWRQDTGKTTPLKSGALPQPGYYEHTKGYTPAGSSERIYPRQKITESWIKDLQRSGFNQGGLTE